MKTSFTSKQDYASFFSKLVNTLTCIIKKPFVATYYDRNNENVNVLTNNISRLLSNILNN